jgi:transcriptional regulator with XRE-family HTH domain
MFAIRMAIQKNILSVLGDNLRAYREAKGWTQKDLAFEVNMEPTYISKIELAKTNPTIKTIDLIATALGCTAADLLKRS